MPKFLEASGKGVKPTNLIIKTYTDATLVSNPIRGASVPINNDSTILNLDRLAHAVSIAETSGCTAGQALRINNCFGIGGTHPKHYDTKEESFEDFKRIWFKYYKRFPDEDLAIKWTGDDKADEWLSIVKKHYND